VSGVGDVYHGSSDGSDRSDGSGWSGLLDYRQAGPL